MRLSTWAPNRIAGATMLKRSWLPHRLRSTLSTWNRPMRWGRCRAIAWTSRAKVFAASQRPEKIGLQPWQTTEVWERLKVALRE